MPSSASRLLWDIEHCTVRLSLFKEKFDVFRNQEDNGIVIVRIDSCGSKSVALYDSLDEQQECELKEKLPLLLKNNSGQRKHLEKIVQTYKIALCASMTSYFRPSWFNDADTSLYLPNNISLYFERSYDEDKNKWRICPLERLRGGRFGKTTALHANEFLLSPEISNMGTKTVITTQTGERHPLYPILLHMTGQEQLQAPFFQYYHTLVSTMTTNEVMVSNMSTTECTEPYTTLIEWLHDNNSFPFTFEDLLCAALRSSSLLKAGIDRGTMEVRFPRRGFKNSSSDDNDIPRPEDRTTKLFLLAISVYGSGTLFFPSAASLDVWHFHCDAKQHELRLIHSHAELIVSLMVERTHKISSPLLTQSDISCGSVARGISFLKGSRSLFHHQLEGLEWCLRMEQSENRGGFVACDMGMGKTIQILLLHLCYPEQIRGKTLVVVPPGLLIQPWYKEATDSRYWGTRDPFPFGKPLLFIRGKGKGKPFPTCKEIQSAELIITSYSTLASHPFLNQIPFRRVILDESTYIKTPSTQRSMAVRNIRTDMHWCLSGTPIENKTEDYLGQLLFLHIAPFYHQDWWFERFEHDRHRMFHSTMFKRNFENIIDGVLIEHSPIQVYMDKEEQAIYVKEKNSLIRSLLGTADMSSAGSQMMKLLRLSRAKEKISVLKEMCMRLLQKVTEFENPFHEAHYHNLLLSYMLEHKEDVPEYICLGNIFPSRNSISQYLDSCKENKEAKDIEEKDLFLGMFQKQVNREKDSVFSWTYQTTSASLGDVGIQSDVITLKNRDLWKKEKCVVFVQGSDRAEEIGKELQSCLSNHTVLIRSSGSAVNADSAVEKFQNDPKASVLVLTFRGGAHGLNLQAARNIFLVDPDWNPAILMQAIARCYRIGQTKDVHVYTLTTANSLEERVQHVIAKKLKLFRENISGVGEDITEWEDISQILKSSLAE